jgi:hypothetical protein
MTVKKERFPKCYASIAGSSTDKAIGFVRLASNWKTMHTSVWSVANMGKINLPANNVLFTAISRNTGKKSGK